jgi:hypothetical protein
MNTRPTLQQATIRNTVLDGKARLANSARKLRTISELLRNTIATTTDRAAITRLTNALAEVESINTNLGALHGVLAELQDHCAPMPESHEDELDFSRQA